MLQMCFGNFLWSFEIQTKPVRQFPTQFDFGKRDQLHPRYLVTPLIFPATSNPQGFGEC